MMVTKACNYTSCQVYASVAGQALATDQCGHKYQNEYQNMIHQQKECHTPYIEYLQSYITEINRISLVCTSQEIMQQDVYLSNIGGRNVKHVRGQPISKNI